MFLEMAASFPDRVWNGGGVYGILFLVLADGSLMARPLRIEYRRAYYQVTSRGNERKAIFRDDSDPGEVY